MKKILEVNAIDNGTVIDHIPSASLFKVINILQLDKSPNQITFGVNLESKRLGSKGLIKISNQYFADYEMDCISLVAPTARINIIKGGEVAEKRDVRVPKHIEGFAACANPNCITNLERISTKFDVIKGKSNKISLLCHYCEKITDEDQIKIK